MSGSDFPKSPAETLDIKVSVNLNCEGHVVSGRRSLELVKKPQSFLGLRQTISCSIGGGPYSTTLTFPRGFCCLEKGQQLRLVCPDLSGQSIRYCTLWGLDDQITRVNPQDNSGLSERLDQRVEIAKKTSSSSVSDQRTSSCRAQRWPSIKYAIAVMVVYSKTAATDKSKSNAELSRLASLAASNECPPSSKKSS